MSEAKKKMTFWQKVDNFWYYYKWWVIAGIFVVFGFWCLLFLLQGQTTDKTGDLTVLSVYAHPLTSEEYDLDNRLKEYVTDVNGDSEKKVVFKPYYITEKGTSETDQLTRGEFEMHLQNCYGDLIIFDELSLNNYLKKDIFAPIGDYIDLSQIPQEDIVSRDGVPVAVKLSGSKMLSDMHFIIDEIYVSVMFLPDNADENVLATRENAKIAIEKLLVKTETEGIEEKN